MYYSTKLPTINFRIPCFIIGYINLVVSIVDVLAQLVVVFIITSGFQCQVSEKSFDKIAWSWMEPILLAVNVGTHGFYPFPLPLRNNQNLLEGYFPVVDEPKCFPTMMHIYIMDLLNFIINIIWLKFVKSFIVALHKKKQEPIRLFFIIYVLKMVFQIIYIKSQPEYLIIENLELSWLIKAMDIGISIICAIIIGTYIRQLREEYIKELPITCDDERLMLKKQDATEYSEKNLAGIVVSKVNKSGLSTVLKIS
ncbi:uncharacterized protein LOC131846413 [Achroia grisella]|uniref:uncharacterized protein LOC131846413 n=1 Tax=Achroia grisella TaxID=688607 RepID=UPI0027D286F3|nr:uncharacterized protein LOC131846413 [Achroia grisella]